MDVEEEYISESEEDNDEEYIPDYQEDEEKVVYISESEGEESEYMTESEEEEEEEELVFEGEEGEDIMEPEQEQEAEEEEEEELVFVGEAGEDIMESEQEEEAEEEEESGEEEKEVEQLEEMRPPFATSWVGPDGITVHGIMCFDDGIIRNLKNQCQLDDCSICYKPPSTSGEHQICCLPCGHTYGLSCIKQWLLLRSSSGKCPKCRTSCSFQDVRLLSPPRLCGTDHRKASSTTLFFPFTEQGSLEFKNYECSRMFDAESLLKDDIIRKNNVEKKHFDLVERNEKMERKESDLLMRAGELELEEQAKPLVQANEYRTRASERAKSLVRADEYRRRASLLIPRIKTLKRRTDALECLASALRRRMVALEQRSESRMGLYQQMYKEHETKKNNNELEIESHQEPSGARKRKQEWDLSPKEKVRKLDVTVSSNH